MCYQFQFEEFVTSYKYWGQQDEIIRMPIPQMTDRCTSLMKKPYAGVNKLTHPLICDEEKNQEYVEKY